MKRILLLLLLQLACLSLWANKCQKIGHGDMFLCPPCICSHTNKRKIIANCTSSHIRFLPNNLSTTIWKLTVSRTKMKTLNTEDILRYPDLNEIKVSSNFKLTKIHGSSVLNQTTTLTIVDFSVNQLKSIGDGSFIVMPFAQNLSLSHNKISKIRNATFEGLAALHHLDLSVNYITLIEHGAFDHMIHLKTLDLSRNRQLGYGAQQLSPRLFVNLKTLHSLFIQSSSNGAKEYPSEALQQLENLESLKIDGLSKGAEFSPGMQSLKHLKHVQLGSLRKHGECYIQNITATFLDYLPYLESFTVVQCILQSIDSNVFAHLKSLKSFSLVILPYYDLFCALDDLQGLVNSSVTSLSFINLDIKAFHCRYLGTPQAKYLQRMKVRHLDLSFNRLAFIGSGFTQNLPATLEKLSLRGNKLTVISQIIERVDHLKHLTELDVGNQNVDYGYSGYQHTNSKDDCKSSPAEEKTLSFWRKFSDDQDNQFNDRSVCIGHSGSNIVDEEYMYQAMSYMTNQPGFLGKTEKFLTLPPKLKKLQAFHFKSFGYLIFRSTLCPKNNSLQEIDFDGSYLTTWGSGKMPPGIIKATLNGNLCNHIDTDFFQPNNSLQHLSLRKNYLGDDFEKDKNGSIFAELDKTRYLDLSTNLIYYLHPPFFKGLTSLQGLNLSDNKLQVLNTSFSHMKQLAYLDLSKNSLMWISPSVRDDLDEIASAPGHVLKIDLIYNQFLCTCDGLEILKWMANSNICFLNIDFLECRFDNGRVGSIGNLSDRFHVLQRHCVSKDLIIAICVASIVFVGVLIILGLIYRNRWKLRYWKYVQMAKMFGFKPRETESGRYKFDAYILYTDETTKFARRECVHELEEKRGHKLCIEDREYLPGTDVPSSIVSAVQNSRKVIPIVTPDFYDNDFSEFRMKMAILEEITQRRSMLHLCLFQPVPEDEMSDDFLTVMKKNCYTEFPPSEELSEEIRQHFWDSLSEAIGHMEEETESIESSPDQGSSSPLLYVP